jgi:hypothetical protein
MEMFVTHLTRLSVAVGAWCGRFHIAGWFPKASNRRPQRRGTVGGGSAPGDDHEVRLEERSVPFRELTAEGHEEGRQLQQECFGRLVQVGPFQHREDERAEQGEGVGGPSAHPLVLALQSGYQELGQEPREL